ncbi:hypothetical protein Lesp02_71580 [Lentzea sp. NBRC 105346]|nr:hypothetical protein Lesp02_71580 [Lentzea sp. NBRC 105346]
MLSGCAYSIQGDAVPGPLPSSSTDPEAPKIPSTRKVADVDPCTLLSKDDLKSLGAPKADPQRQDQRIPQSCQFSMNGGTVVAAIYLPYAETKKKQSLGREVFVEKYSTWLTCTQQGPDMVCTAVVAVQPEKSLLVALALQGASEDKVTATLTPLASAALARLPAA